jgi:membrane protein implicated in regulation of membrane protease activity
VAGKAVPRRASATSERRAQQLVAVSFYLLCAYLAMAVFAGLAANTLLGAWWLDGVVALGIAGWAVVEGRRAWAGESCACASGPASQC